MMMPHTTKILLPFIDDSTLFFALRMRDLLAPFDCRIDLGWMTDRSALSYRQLTDNLPNGPDVIIRNSAFSDPEILQDYDAIITCRIFAPLRDALKKRDMKMSSKRPVVISFQGGLDFTPERGFSNRRHADAVFLVPSHDVDAYRDFAASHQFDWQHVDFGHPAFIAPGNHEGRNPEPRDVYFFAQAISPTTQNARQHMLDCLCVLALRDPSRDVYIKLRHLPGENEAHLHKERFSYSDLLENMTPPPNLKLSAAPMDEILPKVGLGITCTSTAAIDLIRQGVSTQIYLDYREAYLDPLVPKMRELFEGSGLIADLDAIFEGKTQRPNSDWQAQMFCDADLGQRVLRAIENVQTTAIRVDRVLSA